jgi:hypothetical protein
MLNLFQHPRSSCRAGGDWTLKQVQGDGCSDSRPEAVCGRAPGRPDKRGIAMPRRLAAAAAAFSLVASPCSAAELVDFKNPGARRSGAALGAYVRLPLGARPDGQSGPAAGLRLTAVHDYRTAGAPRATLVESDTLDLRLIGSKKPALFLAGVPVTGEERRKQNLSGVNTVVTVVLIAAAAVGGYYLARAIDDSGEE